MQKIKAAMDEAKAEVHGGCFNGRKLPTNLKEHAA